MNKLDKLLYPTPIYKTKENHLVFDTIVCANGKIKLHKSPSRVFRPTHLQVIDGTLDFDVESLCIGNVHQFLDKIPASALREKTRFFMPTININQRVILIIRNMSSGERHFQAKLFGIELEE